MSNIRNTTRITRDWLAYASGWSINRIRKLSIGGTLILAYHRVLPESFIRHHPIMPGISVSTDAFTRQLEWLSARFKLVCIDDVVKGLSDSKPGDEPCCAITFDDGWYDNYEFALPILEKYNAPTTIYIVLTTIGTAHASCFDKLFELLHSREPAAVFRCGISRIDDLLDNRKMAVNDKFQKVVGVARTIAPEQFRCLSNSISQAYRSLSNWCELDSRYKMLGWPQMREMMSRGVSFGYHSKSHQSLPTLGQRELIDEIRFPEQEALMHGVTLQRHFCCPAGKYDLQTIRELKDQGYRSAVSLDQGFNYVDTDPFILRRYNIHSGNSRVIPMLAHTIAKCSPIRLHSPN